MQQSQIDVKGNRETRQYVGAKRTAAAKAVDRVYSLIAGGVKEIWSWGESTSEAAARPKARRRGRVWPTRLDHRD